MPIFTLTNDKTIDAKRHTASSGYLKYPFIAIKDGLYVEEI